MVTNIMWLNNIGAIAVLVTCMPVSALETVVCPAFLKGDKSNVLRGARLFDGDPADQVELVPDNENGATWDIGGYKNTNRQIYLVCDFKNGKGQIVMVKKYFTKCSVAGKKKISAWCEK